MLHQTPAGPTPPRPLLAPPSAAPAPWYASEPALPRGTPPAPATHAAAEGEHTLKRGREPSSRSLAEELLRKRPSLEGMSSKGRAAVAQMMSLDPAEVRPSRVASRFLFAQSRLRACGVQALLAFGAVLQTTFQTQYDREACLVRCVRAVAPHSCPLRAHAPARSRS